MINLGFCYGTNPLTGRSALCCDFCDHCKGEIGANNERIKSVVKKRCPYGYCQSWATCNQCAAQGLHKSLSSIGFSCDKKEDAELRRNHNGCKTEHEKYETEKRIEAMTLEAGKWLRVSALDHGDMVKVIFRNANNEARAYFMHSWIYGSIPLMVLATPEDYAKYGELIEAKNTDIYDPEQYAEVKPLA